MYKYSTVQAKPLIQVTQASIQRNSNDHLITAFLLLLHAGSVCAKEGYDEGAGLGSDGLGEVDLLFQDLESDRGAVYSNVGLRRPLVFSYSVQERAHNGIYDQHVTTTSVTTSFIKGRLQQSEPLGPPIDPFPRKIYIKVHP